MISRITTSKIDSSEERFPAEDVMANDEHSSSSSIRMAASGKATEESNTVAAMSDDPQQSRQLVSAKRQRLSDLFTIVRISVVSSPPNETVLRRLRSDQRWISKQSDVGCSSFRVSTDLQDDDQCFISRKVHQGIYIRRQHAGEQDQRVLERY